MEYYSFGFVRDEGYVAVLPQVMLGNHAAPKPMGVMAIHHAGDGLPPCAPPGLDTPEDLRQTLAKARENATTATIDACPAVLNGTYPWRSQTEPTGT